MLLAVLFLGLFSHDSGPVPHKINAKGHFEQGGLVEIHAPEDTEITLDGEDIDSVSPGHYLLAFGRDAAPAAKLKIRFSDGAKEHHNLNIQQQNYKTQNISGVDNVINSPSTNELNVIHKEVFQLATARHMGDYTCPHEFHFARPAPGRVSSVFGSQRIYNGVAGKPHSGTDFAGSIGDPAYAPENGKVVFLQDMILTGKTMAIDHGCGVVSTLMHLSASEKEVGDEVKKGEVVARIGKTGIATGPHLHWSLNLGSTRLDPLLVLQ